MRQFPKKFRGEFKIFKKLSTPEQVQDFLLTFPFNFNKTRDSCWSPLAVLKKGKANCIEGALLAAAALWYHGRAPMLLDLDTTDDDDPHVLTLFKKGNKWGAVSKTNHSVLRYRDPVYASWRELAMSYFHEYFLPNGKKTMRRYSAPFNLARFKDDWLISPKNLWEIHDALDASRHVTVLPYGKNKFLRKADPVERKAIQIPEWKS